MKPTAVFVISIYNYHREMSPVVREFVSAGWNVAVIVGWRGKLADEAAEQYRALGCSVYHLRSDIAYPDPDAAHTSGRHASSKAPKLRKAWLGNRLVEGLALLRTMSRVRASMRKLLDGIAPTVVFFGPFHSCGTFDNAVAAWARRRTIPMCCLPVSSYHGEKGAVLARFSNLRMGMLQAELRTHHDSLNRIVSKLFPQWTRWRDGDGIFMWDPMRLLAARACGLIEKELWQKPSPDMDAVFVFSSFSRHLLEESGYPMDRVIVAGIPLLDAVFSQARDKVYREKLYGDLGIPTGAPFILYNVEPSAEHHYLDWEQHWANFHSMMRVVTAQNLPVVLSLHPLCRQEDYSFAEQEYGVRLSRGYKIHELYPHAWLVVSFVCSTNLVAEVFHKQLVIYDLFRFAAEGAERESEFRLPCALIGHTPEEVGALIQQALITPDHETANMQWSGGHACERIRSHVESLLASFSDRGLEATVHGNVNVKHADG